MLDWGRQYRQKLNAWVNTLHEQICTEVEPLTLMGSVLPDDQHGLPNETDYTRMPEGTPWGPKWSYGYFMTSFTVSSKMEGRRLVFMGGPGGETLVHVQGKARGSLDREHRYVLLTRCAKKGESFKLFMESYAGHGERLENIGPLTPESHALAPVPACQCTVQHSCVAIWDEDAYQLWMDVQTLTDLLSILPEKSLRAQKVAQGLYDFMQIVDFEQSLEQRDALYREAREHLSSLMTCQNGSTAPLMWLIGQSHIDLAWLWPMNETYHKAVRTYSNQVTLLDEYPTYRFLLCEPALLDMLQATDPELFAAIEGKVRNGQILPEGAFFVECDTNIPGGESLIRQLKWGKEWFEKLGVDTQVAWLPDCFGFSAALPQLLKGMHIPYFATQKLQRQDPECEGFPFHHFIWEGVDGSEVVALSFMKDNGPVSPKSFQERWETNRVQDRDIQVLLHPFGYGDGGGGPTRDMVESALRLRDLRSGGRPCHRQDHRVLLLRFLQAGAQDR